MKKEITEEYLCYCGGRKRLEDIKSLDLSNHDLTTLDVELFNKLKTLKTLDLSQNHLTCIPDGLKLPALTVLDCTQNRLQSVSFTQNFKNLKELYFDDNKQLVLDDECIVRVLCPGIKKINDYEDSEQLDITIRLYTNQLQPQLEAVWEAKYSEVYGSSIPAEEIESLHEEFVTTVKKSEIIGSHLSMGKLKEFMIEHLSRELISNINNRISTSHDRADSGKSSKYSTRVASGTTPLKNYRHILLLSSELPALERWKKYRGHDIAFSFDRIFKLADKEDSSGTPMEVDDDINQGQKTPTRGQRHRSPTKGQGRPTPTRTSKRKRDSEEGEGTPLKLRKVGGSSTPSKNVSTPSKGSHRLSKGPSTPSKMPGTPRFTVLKQNSEPQEGYRLPSVDDFDPEIFLRCHSKGNNPGDDETKVWRCAFEPRTDREGETTNMVATCGGKLVCLIDCQTGKVLRRYKDNSKSESFYALAWTTLEADNKNLKEDVNILAVAGYDGQIKLIQPRQLVMFGVLEGHRCYIDSLIFHPEKKNILFSASKDNKIIMWDISTPDFKTNKVEYRQIASLRLPNTDAIGMVVCPDLDVLVAGCEKSCYAWDVKKLSVGKKDVVPHYEFVHPQEENMKDSSETVDGIAMLSNNCVVSKCVGHSCLYLWDLKTHLVKRNSTNTKGVQVQPLALLEYTPVTVDYVYLSAFKDLLCVGTDKGRVYMYNLKKVVKQKKASDQILRPSRVIEYPDRNVDNKFTSSMTDVSENEDIVINSVGLSSSREFLVYGTDNNIVAVWRNSSKL